jgi:hypothetical protein
MDNLEIDYDYIGEKRKRIVYFNPDGLAEEEFNLIKKTAIDVFDKVEKEDLGSFSRCTFFAEPGLEALEEIVKTEKSLKNPEIRGCDSNPFDQHYWVEVTIKKDSRKVIIDPIFGYVGLFDKASNTTGHEYYNHSRHVIPNKHVSEGGVRINTNGVM